jgi:SAM-dependent methyltransferase
VTGFTVDSPLSPERARAWLERWDRNQQGYVPGREERFAVMVDVLRELAGERPLVLDLACGPGSLTDRVLRGIPGATVIAVDLDPLLLALGKAAYGEGGGRITWADANLAEPTWREVLAGRPVDAALSTTALHWLEVDALLALYRDLGEVIREGGVFLNGDQMEHPPTERRIGDAVRALRERRAEAAFAQPGMEQYWDWYAELRALPELRALAEERDRRFTAPRPERRAGYELHRAALLNAGFGEVGSVWQELDSRVLMAVR